MEIKFNSATFKESPEVHFSHKIDKDTYPFIKVVIVS